MSKSEQPERYGRRGERKIVNLQEGFKGESSQAGVRAEQRKGNSASTQTDNRKPPQGGSGTAPPQQGK